ncbi:MAG: PrsW family intramembrane metalloprotease [Kiritimatiellaceae bacterium]|nr:PrsW family intramembrane metalloprotease [Kiritimatiellaceae bacterium]
MLKTLLIGLSFIFGILSIRHLRKFDVHEEEPFSKMLTVTIWGGLISVVVSLFIYSTLKDSGVDIHGGFPFSFFYIGFVEEGAKLLALFLCWPIIRNEMDEPTDGLIYIACVALGFSLIENYFYAAVTPMSSPLIAIRLLICTPMHIAFSMFMGLAFFWAIRFKGGWGVLFGAYFVAATIHTLYDIFVSFWFLLPGLFFIVKGAYRWMYCLLGYTAAQSPFRQSLSEFIHGQPLPETKEGLTCLDCGNRAPKPTYTSGRIRIQKCEECGAYACADKTITQLVHHYGSTFGSLRKKTKPISRSRKQVCVIIQGNRIDRKKKTACFDLNTFNNALEEMTQNVIIKTEKKWWCVWKAANE